MSAEQISQRLSERAERVEQDLRLTDIETAGREEISDRLAHALMSHRHSEIVAHGLQRLIRHFRDTYGVTISAGDSPEDARVSVSPGFSGSAMQQQVTLAAAWKRESAAVLAATEILDAVDLPDRDAAAQAITDWHGEWPDPARFDEEAVRTRRSELESQLTVAGVDDSIRADVLFVVDYLTAQPVSVDLQQTSVMVDPADEMKGRVQGLLDELARNPHDKAAWARMNEEIAVLAPADQEAVQEEGREIRPGLSPGSPWMEYQNRDRVAARLRRYAKSVQNVIDYAHRFATDLDAEIAIRETSGSWDEIFIMLNEVQDERRYFTVLTEPGYGSGLAEMEQQQLAAVLGDLDVGTSTELPELLWADDRSKQHLDYSRGSEYAGTLARHAEQQMKAVLAEAGVNDLDDNPLHVSADSIADHLGRIRDRIAIAGTSTAGDGDAGEVEQRDKSVAEFGQALVVGGVPQPARSQVKAILDAGFADVDRFGEAFRNRMQRWSTRRMHTSTEGGLALAETDGETSSGPGKLIEAAFPRPDTSHAEPDDSTHLAVPNFGTPATSEHDIGP